MLGRTNAVPSIDFDTTDKPDIPALPRERNVAPPRPEIHSDYNPFSSNREIPARKPAINWEELYGMTSGKGPSEWNTPSEEASAPVSKPPEEASTLFTHETESHGQTYECTQFNGQYIATPAGSGLMLIEQHRAHVRILYDRFMRQLQGKHGASQGMLFPEMFQIPPSEAIQMDLLLNDFSLLGFDISNMGGGSFSIQGVPPGIEGLDPCKLVTEMLASAIEKKDNVQSAVQSNMALTMARSAAIVVGQVLSHEEMAAVVAELLACPMPNFTPDGKRIICIIEEQEIAKMFM